MISFFSFSLLLLSILSIIKLSSSTTFSDFTTDQNALLAFKNAITPNTNIALTKSWVRNTSICSWTGVSCSLKHYQRVTSLNLTGLGFVGQISPHLGNLTFLQYLDISSNNFTGSIPSSLSKLRRLNVLNVGFNSLTGEIPSGIMTNMSELIEIDLRSNKLAGELPTHICSTTPKLKRIFLSRNELNGKIPTTIDKCTELDDLRLSNNQFSGNIPSEIGNLKVLTSLALTSNNIQGNIPSSIFNISSLEYLDLSSNNLSGTIPTFINLPRLGELYLNDNKFSGSIPEQIGSLTSLMYLVLSSNNLTGDLPKQIGNISLLVTLDVAHNKLSGELPKELGNLAYLEVFAASFNDFLSGSIPSSIFNISTLKALSLQQNLLSGSLPSNLGISLVSLEQLSLFYNRLSGEIPSSITNASKLTILELNRNSFTGSIPDFGNLRLLKVLRLWKNNLTGADSPDQELGLISSLTKCRDLVNLEISNNPLNGILPTSIGNLSTSLLTFAAFNCNIKGAIPTEIANLKSLRALELSENQLTGIIPMLGKKLQGVYLRNNQLQGNIPHHLCQLSNLVHIDLSGNMLTGPIHACFGDLKSLERVTFSSNKLNSTIPSNLWNLIDLVMLDLSSNNLSGQIPSQIKNMKAMNQLDLSSNQLSGDIPTSIDGCESLVFLSLSTNLFTGSIPESLPRGLTTLDLSNNDLSGEIPSSLKMLKLEHFNVSYNKLQGKIPDEGCFHYFTAQSFLNNSGLCGATRFEVSSCAKEHGRSRSKKTVALIMKYVVPPFIAVMILVIVILALIKRRKQKQIPASDISSVGTHWKIISERELTQGTSSFSDMNLLGTGSFGSVFKATLADVTQSSKTVIVAVKVFNLQVEGALKSFDTESQILSTIRHRNLVRILGCCSNTQFKALILDYMPNGSLDKWLHSDTYVLDLVQRLNIAIDVALALEYLHHDHTFTVVHCDIKPHNVLLGEDMTAHVADFGISKLFATGEAATHTITMATIGYAAPELGSEGKISTSGDVYSYGTLLLEMFTGKKPTDDMFSAEMSIKEWVGKALHENATSEVVAPGLLSREDRNFSAKEQCVSSVLDLAMKCLAFSPDERINMMQVVAALQKFKVAVEGVKRKHSESR